MDSLSKCDTKQREHAVRQEDAFKASISMDTLNKQKSMMCTNTTKRMLCPKELSPALAGTCVDALAVFYHGLGNDKLHGGQGLKCAAGEKYCDQQGTESAWGGTHSVPLPICARSDSRESPRTCVRVGRALRTRRTVRQLLLLLASPSSAGHSSN